MRFFSAKEANDILSLRERVDRVIEETSTIFFFAKFFLGFHVCFNNLRLSLFFFLHLSLQSLFICGPLELQLSDLANENTG